MEEDLGGRGQRLFFSHVEQKLIIEPPKDQRNLQRIRETNTGDVIRACEGESKVEG